MHPDIPTPGSFGLSRIPGFTGWWVNIGQHLAGDGSPYTHAFLVLDNGQVLQGMPGGATIVPLAHYLGRDDVVFSTLPQLDAQQALDVVRIARTYLGADYSFASYLALALMAGGIRPLWLRRYVAQARGSICSALVDRVYHEAGVDLFADGRPYGFVTPGALDRYRRGLPADPPYDSALDRLRELRGPLSGI